MLLEHSAFVPPPARLGSAEIVGAAELEGSPVGGKDEVGAAVAGATEGADVGASVGVSSSATGAAEEAEGE